MSYIRTTPYREPIRIEFFDAYEGNNSIRNKDIIGLTYFLSLFYPHYGMPIILKYADMLARTPKTLVERLVKVEIQNILREESFDLETIQRIFNSLSRSFLRR